jgi:hypothetical protein
MSATHRGRALALTALLAMGSTPALAAAPTIASGAYDNTLLVAVAPDGRVTAYLAMHQSGPPIVDCIAYFRGKFAGNGGAVTASVPGLPDEPPITGQLVSTGAGAIRITLPEEPPGCGNVWSFANKDEPADFELQQREPWTVVRVVKARKAYFSPTPGAPHGRGYVVEDDGVGVRATQNGWVQADFMGETHTSSGWLKESDLYPP